MTSADHEDIKIDTCIIVQAGNGGWIVYRCARLGEAGDALAAVKNVDDLTAWLKAHLAQ